MVDDGAHEKWRSARLDTALHDRLGENCSLLEEIAEGITKIAEDITKTAKGAEEGLECFDCLEEAREKVSSRRGSVARRANENRFEGRACEEWPQGCI
jgi:hypothetical protein